ncbi:MAG: DEAD/DEAH box helicase [Acidimicrobiales bacterium]
MPSTFSALGVGGDLAACLAAQGISKPYPIQSVTIPDALAGRDLFAQSPTGSGKTLAFAIPLVARIGKAQRHRPRGLVLAPTRELAAQITEAILPLARSAQRRIAPFYGGTGYKSQLDALNRGVDIVVGCPGRLIDLMERGTLNLVDIEVVVIDEADRMADMGFLPAVRRLLDEIGGRRQTMLFSATLTRDVERIVRDYQHHPSRHVLERPSDDVGSRTHEFWRATRSERADLTARLAGSHGSCIVFCRTKRGVDRLMRQLAQAGVHAVAIHGDRSQAQRERALSQFRDRRAQVLVGTDVASRGIHVDGVDCVVHYDLPEDEDTYVHRSGRTGRAGASGRVVSLVCPDEERGARLLQKRLGLDSRLVLPPRTGETTAGWQHAASDRHDDVHGSRRASQKKGDVIQEPAASRLGSSRRSRQRPSRTSHAGASRPAISVTARQRGRRAS